MESEKYLVEAQVVLQFLKGKTELFNIFDEIEKLYISQISIGELYAIGQIHKENKIILEIISDFIKLLKNCSIDENTVSCFGKIKAEMQKKSLSAGDNKIWLAAAAMAGNMCLITMDDFYKKIDGLKVKLIET